MELLGNVSGVPTAVEAVQRNMEIADPILVASGRWYTGTEAERSAKVPEPEAGRTFYIQTDDNSDTGGLPEGAQRWVGDRWVPLSAMKRGDKWYCNIPRESKVDPLRVEMVFVEI